MIIGYARVSTPDKRDVKTQERFLKAHGAKKIYMEKASGSTMKRQELQTMLSILKPGDQVLVYKLDRISRSYNDFHQICDIIHKKGASFKSITQDINTEGVMGKMILSLLAGFAEMEGQMIKDRVKAGLHWAITKGFRHKRWWTAEERAQNIKMVEDALRRNGFYKKNKSGLFKISVASIAKKEAAGLGMTPAKFVSIYDKLIRIKGKVFVCDELAKIAKNNEKFFTKAKLAGQPKLTEKSSG